MEYLKQAVWSPYVVGAAIGILSWITFVISNKPLGCSTAYARTSGMIGNIFGKKHIENNAYYKQFKPEIDWEWMLVIGMFIGAFISAKLSNTFAIEWTPNLWIQSFGNTPILRLIIAFIGGIFMGIGARWAGGCTSGHGISGTMQLSISSWITAICFFIGGIAAALLIFRVIGG